MRQSLSKRTRFNVFKRDGFRCGYCGRRPPEVILVVDHVVPVADGGSNEEANLTTACVECNAGKGAIPLSDTPPAVDEDALAAAAQEIAERRMLLDQYFAERRAFANDMDLAVAAARDAWMDLLGQSGDPDWSNPAHSSFEERSIVNFIRRGMTLDDIRAAIRNVDDAWQGRPLNRNALWLIFCKTCWNAIRSSGVTW